jgi:hypothetical protein
MRNGPRSKETPRRGGLLLAGLLFAGSAALGGCNVEPPQTEPIPSYPVPPLESVPTGLAPPSVSETTPPEPKTFTVCFGAFVDYSEKILTVDPIVAPVKGRDPEQLNPLIVQFNEDGSPRPFLQRLPYETEDFDWLDSRGKNIGDSPPSTCEDVPLHAVQIVRADRPQSGTIPAIASPEIRTGQIINVEDWTPGEALDSGLYNQPFAFDGPNGLRALQRSMLAS